MKLIKRIFLVLVILVVLVIGALLAVPFVFKDELVEVVKEQVNANINATAEFADVDLTFFRSFPHLTLALQDFSLTGKGEFAELRLVEAAEASVTVNVQSLLGEDTPLEIRAVALSQPNVHVVVRADGLANYDIAIPAEEAAEENTSAAAALQIALQEYSIEEGSVLYDDRAGDIYLEITDLNHSGSGNLTLTEYDLDTETTIGSMTVEQGNIAFLKNARVALAAIFHINTEESLYQLRDNELRVNELLLNADGEVQLQEEDIRLDLAFNSPGSDFRSLWSLIPNAYTADYQDVAVTGTFSLDGLVKGIYNETTYPAFRVKTSVKDGQVKYPDLPLGISNIQADLDVNSPGSNLDQMLIKAEQLALQVGSDPFNARFLVKTPISDPDVDATVDGVIDLKQWAQAFPIEGIQEMAGRIIADVNVKTRLSTLEREAYDQVQMAGDVRIDQLLYQGEGLPRIIIETASASFTPQRVRIADFTAQLGESDVQASGQIDNILAYISPEKTMRGSFRAHTNYFLVDEWMPEEEETAVDYQATTTAVEEEAIFDRFDLQLDATANRIVYDTYELTDAVLQGRVKPNRIDVQNVRSKLGESDFSGSGTILNGFDYAFKDGVLGGDLVLNSSFLDLNAFMEEPAEGTGTNDATTEAYGVIPIPANIDMTMGARVDRLRYTDMELRDIEGRLTIQDETVIIENGRAKTLGGSMGFTGAYDTKDVSRPAYDFRFDLNQLNFQETFNTFNSFASFAPVGKLVDGQFSTSLIMSGELGSDMMPDLQSVNAEGLFETLNGSLTGLQPLSAIGNALNIAELQESVALDRLKTWFTIENGTVAVEPFDVKLADLPMTIAGRHGLTQDMSYTINTVIPRSKLGNGTLGSSINQGVSALVNQAGKLGLNVNDAENLNVQIALTGNMADPKVGFKLLGTDGETSLAEAAKGQAQDLVNNEVDKAKEQITSEVDKVKESVTEQTTALVDSAKNVAKDQLQQAGQTLLNQATGNAPKDSTATGTNLETQTQEAIDKIKGDIKDFNPFRRKKKKDGG